MLLSMGLKCAGSLAVVCWFLFILSQVRGSKILSLSMIICSSGRSSRGRSWPCSCCNIFDSCIGTFCDSMGLLVWHIDVFWLFAATCWTKPCFAEHWCSTATCNNRWILKQICMWVNMQLLYSVCGDAPPMHSLPDAPNRTLSIRCTVDCNCVKNSILITRWIWTLKARKVTQKIQLPHNPGFLFLLLRSSYLGSWFK
jgi:hypothetical protein